MGVALSIVFLFTISTTIVRVMSVVLEHTGVPQSIARIQVLSAFSGTGFTTAESEMLLETPERRQILVILMIAGSVGLASIAATVIVGALGVADTLPGILQQAVLLVCALLFVRYVVFAGAVDSLICRMAHRWLHGRGYDVRSYAILHRLGADSYIAEHWVKEGCLTKVDAQKFGQLQILGLREDQNQSTAIMPFDPTNAPAGATLLALGSRAAHDEFAERYGCLQARGGH